jgi:alginate O-acetyltransferase complex protein AlgI
LTRFLTAYLYNPLVLWLTRRRAEKGRPGFGLRNPSLGAFVSLLMVPLITTMFISGLWHGAGYGFVIWGLLHGIFLTINHGWRVFVAHRWSNRPSYERIMKPTGFTVTFLSVSAAMVFFRASTVTSAIDLVKGVIGLNGFSWPHGVGAIAQNYGTDSEKAAMWIAALLFIALVCPNTLQMLAPYEPALGVKRRSAAPMIGATRIPTWNPSLPWAVAVSTLAAIAVVSVGGPSEFLYWQF